MTLVSNHSDSDLGVWHTLFLKGQPVTLRKTMNSICSLLLNLNNQAKFEFWKSYIFYPPEFDSTLFIFHMYLTVILSLEYFDSKIFSVFT